MIGRIGFAVACSCASLAVGLAGCGSSSHPDPRSAASSQQRPVGDPEAQADGHQSSAAGAASLDNAEPALNPESPPQPGTDMPSLTESAVEEQRIAADRTEVPVSEDSPEDRINNSADQSMTSTAAQSATAETVGGADESLAEEIALDHESRSETEPAKAVKSSSEPTAGPPPMRLLLPTTSGTLIAAVDVRVGGRSLSEYFARRVEAVLAASTKGSERPNWEQLVEHARSDPQTFGPAVPNEPGQVKALIARYDRNRNRRPEADELTRFLFRQSGYYGPFRVFGTDHYRNLNRSHSQLFELLDRDDDRQLDDRELKLAAESILRLDRDADRGISLNEAIREPAGAGAAWNPRRTHRRGSVAMDLEDYVDWALVSYSLDPESDGKLFGVADSAIAAVDEDQNGSISEREARLLRDVGPDVALDVQFSGDDLRDPAIQVREIRPSLQDAVTLEQSPAAVTLSGPGLRVVFEMLDQSDGQQDIPAEVFAMFDANSDGLLDPDEIPPQAAGEISLEQMDADGDGKLSLVEINRGRRRSEPIWMIQVRGRAAEFTDGVFAWLDQDHDRFLCEREILAAEDRLRQCGQLPLRAASIPDTFVVRFARGNPEQDAQTFRYERKQVTPPASLPRWAREMDSNDDGDISAGEFLGTPRQFADFDDNADGFLDDAEVMQIESVSGVR